MPISPTTVKSQAIVKIAANQYILMHPETDADIVKLAVEGITATNVQDAIAELHQYIAQITGGGVVTGVKGEAEETYRTGQVNITKDNIGLGNVQNLAPADMPVSTATQEALDGKANTSGTYPGITAGAVQAALTFGNKTYNGSSAQTLTKADLGLASAYIPQGSITFESLPTPSASNLGYVYDMSDAFTTTDQFLEGAGKEYPAGTNVAIVQSGDDYKYDVLGSALVDLSNYAQINGTYPNMTVGKATADGNGNNISDTYATQTGTYSGMTVGTATNAGNVTGSIAGQAISDIFESNGTTVKQATSATQLATAQDINLTGDATGTASFNGTAAANITVTLANTGIAAGTYSSLTIDAKGRATAGGQMVEVGEEGQDEPSANLAIGGTFYKRISDAA